MRLIHFADLHIGMENYGRIDPKTGLHSRLLDFLSVFDFLIEYAIDHHVDAVLFAGDAFKARDPNPTHQKEFGKRIRRLVNEKIPVVLVIGNHDTSLSLGRATSLEIYPALEIDGVWVSRHPEILMIPTKNGDLQLLTVPWLAKQEFLHIGDTLHYLYGKLASDLPTVMVSHADVTGAIYGSERQVSISTTGQVIPLSLFTHPKVQYVALGHIHKHQCLAEHPPIVYAGSPDRIDFGEEKEQKGFVDVSLENGKATWHFIPTPARPFVTVRCAIANDAKDPTDEVLKAIKEHDCSGAILRIILSLPSDLHAELNLETIRRSCAHAYYVSGIVRNIERTDRAHVFDAKEVETLTPLDALLLYCRSKQMNQHHIEILKNTAQALIVELAL